MSWSKLLLSKFPSFDPAWSSEVQAKWFNMFERLKTSGQSENSEDAGENTLQQLRALIHLGRVLEQIIADLEPKLIGCSREQELAYKQALKDFRQELAEHASVPYEGRFLQQREAVGVAKGLRLAHAHFLEWFKNGFTDIEDELDWCEAKAKEVEGT